MNMLPNHPQTAEPVVFISKRAQAHDPWSVISAILWKIPVVAAGIFVGVILAGIVGLFLGWFRILC